MKSNSEKYPDIFVLLQQFSRKHNLRIKMSIGPQLPPHLQKQREEERLQGTQSFITKLSYSLAQKLSLNSVSVATINLHDC